MLHVVRNLIIKEVELADFVAIQADETTDVSVQDQMVFILRYTLGHKIYKGFWGYFLPLSHTVDGISS
jgi:RsiW-degrading membrane proteinase PrsW (M82 family)